MGRGGRDQGTREVHGRAWLPGSTHSDTIAVSDTLGNTVTDAGSFKIAVIKIGINFGTEHALGGVPGRGGGYRITSATGTVLKPYVLARSGTNPSSYIAVPQNLGAGVYGEGNYIVFTGLTAPAIKVEATTVAPQRTGNPPRAPINAIQLVPSAPPAKPTLAVKKTATGIEVTYQGTLQSAAAVNGPYTDVSGATSPYTSATTGAPKFFRARN